MLLLLHVKPPSSALPPNMHCICTSARPDPITAADRADLRKECRPHAAP